LASSGKYFWEIFEFTIDQTIGGSLAGPMQANNFDTMTDMIFVLIGSVIVAVTAVLWFRTHDKDDVMQEKAGEG
jgi:hypothetical protein